jgi:excinuclease ABC subunit C
MLQRLRDESHRFAITFHRQKRAKSMITSALDGVPGLGPSKQKALLKHFGSVKRIRAASLDQLQEAQGVGRSLAASVHAALHPELAPDSAPDEASGQAAQPDADLRGINLSTGEILD